MKEHSENNFNQFPFLRQLSLVITEMHTHRYFQKQFGYVRNFQTQYKHIQLSTEPSKTKTIVLNAYGVMGKKIVVFGY